MVKNDGKNAAAKKTARNILSVAAPFITLGAAVLAWAIVAKIVDAEILAPSVKSVFLSVIKLIKSGEFYASAAFTALRAFAAFTISFLSAFLLAALSHKYPLFKRFVSPVCAVVKTTPAMSVILIVIVVFSSKISPVIIAFTVLFPVAYNDFLSGLSMIDGEILEMATVYKVSKKTLNRYYIYPFVLKTAAVSAVNELSFSLKITVSAEVMSATAKSIGRLLYMAKVNLETADLVAVTLLAVVLGGILDYFAAKLKNKFFKKEADDGRN